VGELLEASYSYQQAIVMWKKQCRVLTVCMNMEHRCNISHNNREAFAEFWLLLSFSTAQNWNLESINYLHVAEFFLRSY
jgi:hypothetical protein